MDNILSLTFNAAVIAIPAAIAVTAAIKSFFTVQPKEAALVTRFGKLIRTESAQGLHMKVPFIDKIDQRIGLELRQVTENLTTKTNDDLFPSLPITIQFEVDDAEKFYYGNNKPVDNLKSSVSKAVRSAASGKSFQELFDDKDGISETVIDHIKEEAAEYGIALKRIIIDQPKLPQAIEDAYNERKASERSIETATNRAKAHATEVVKKAEADAQAQALAGKGASDFRKAILDGYRDQMTSLTEGGKITAEQALVIITQAMALDAMRDVAAKGNLVIVPQNFNGGELAQLKALQQLQGPKVA